MLGHGGLRELHGTNVGVLGLFLDVLRPADAAGKGPHALRLQHLLVNMLLHRGLNAQHASDLREGHEPRPPAAHEAGQRLDACELRHAIVQAALHQCSGCTYRASFHQGLRQRRAGALRHGELLRQGEPAGRGGRAALPSRADEGLGHGDNLHNLVLHELRHQPWHRLLPEGVATASCREERAEPTQVGHWRGLTIRVCLRGRHHSRHGLACLHCKVRFRGHGFEEYRHD
mmetsp:Transcript_67371/g.196963  ORF Transcript_67371/g.196963 Transcript_67371/m.196963 type:complete len:230 (-) Transcript_67371:356-1045(-)